MKPRSLLIFPAVLLLVLVAGCSSSRTVTIGARSVDIDAVRRSIEAGQSSLGSMTGEGQLRIETPEMSQSGDFRLVLRKPDSLSLVVEGPFGIRVVNALVTRTRFQAFNALQNTVYTGASTPENLKRVLRLDVSFDDIMGMLTGGSFIADDQGAPDATAAEGEDALFTFTSGETTRRYLIDPSTLALRKFQVLNSKGILIFEQTFSDFFTIGGTLFPRIIRITQPQRHQVLTLKYDRAEHDLSGGPINFSVPRNARVVDWK